MNIITLAELKAHLRIEEDDDLEDELLSKYGEAAEKSVEHMLNRTWADIYDTYGEVPADLQCAILSLAAHLYKNREPISSLAQNHIPYQFKSLITPYVRL